MSRGGDTAELVLAAKDLLVPHPPGYPLFIWLFHFWLKLPLETEFWRASLLSLLFGSLTIFVFLRNKPWWILPMAIAFMTFPEFLEASLLPDVFSLHALLVSLFLALFLSQHPKRSFFVPFLFFLSAANHHSTVFLTPCLFLCLWEERFSRQSLSGITVGVALTTGLYFSLFLCDVTHPFSWGNLRDFSTLVGHVLRKDYGTFKLVATEATHAGEALFFLLKRLALFLPPVIFALLFVRPGQDRRLLSLALSLVGLFGFSLMMNIRPEFVGKEILGRFHVMPLIVLSFFLATVVSGAKLSPKAQWIFAASFLPLLFQNLFEVPRFRFLRHDSVIEDHARNLLLQGRRYKPVIIVAEGDSSFFAMRYLSKPEEGIGIISLPLLFHEWYQEKLKLQVPQYAANPKVWKEKRLDVSPDLVRPNIGNINFLFLQGPEETDWYKLTFLPLGRMLSSGAGVSFSEIPLVRRGSFGAPQESTKTYLFFQYSYFFMAQAYYQKEPAKKLQFYKKALATVPYALPAAKLLCESEKSPVCDEGLLKAMEIRASEFLPK